MFLILVLSEEDLKLIIKYKWIIWEVIREHWWEQMETKQEGEELTKVASKILL